MKAKELENTLRQCPRCATGTTYKGTCPLCYLPTITYDAWEARRHKEKEAAKTIDDTQIQEIDKHICVIESTVKMLERNSVDTLVRETVFAATAKISDILAGEGSEKKPDEKKPARYFFALETFAILTHGQAVAGLLKRSCLFDDLYLEVAEENLPYLKEPAGAWEFREVGTLENYIGYTPTGHGKQMRGPACEHPSLGQKRWCEPAKPIAKKKEKTVRYFFNLGTKRVLKYIGTQGSPYENSDGVVTNPEGCIGDLSTYLELFGKAGKAGKGCLEVAEENLPYLKKPEGEWEFRKYNDGDTVLEYKTDGHGGPVYASCPPFVDDSNVVLRRYRWCKPRKVEPKTVRCLNMDTLKIEDLTEKESRSSMVVAEEYVEEALERSQKVLEGLKALAKKT